MFSLRNKKKLSLNYLHYSLLSGALTLSEAKVPYEHNINSIYRCINSSLHKLLTNHMFGNFVKSRMLELCRTESAIFSPNLQYSFFVFNEKQILMENYNMEAESCFYGLYVITGLSLWRIEKNNLSIIIK